jgi:hypothetical protein
MKKRIIKLFLALFTLVIFTNLSTAQVNMNRWIELTVQQGVEIWFDYSADAANTEVKVVCGAYETTFVAGTERMTFVNDSTEATTMKVYGNLKEFVCINQYEKVTELDASNNTGLVVLHCWNNNLSSLNVSGLTILEELECGENNLSSLDASGLTALKDLYCYDNNLSSLLVDGLTALKMLLCNGNNLSFLSVNGLTVLKALYCYTNNLSTIKISGCDSLNYIDCSGNNLSACGLDSLFHQLPRRPIDNKGFIMVRDGGEYDQPGAYSCRDTIATNRNWNVWDDATPIINSNYECPYFTLGIEELIVNNINARVYPNPVSNYLNIECEESINKLELYDAFGRIVISQESVQNNTSIDVSSLANGIYILKLRTAEGVGEYKVVKN